MICPKVLILVLYVSDNINADVLNARERVMADKPWCRRCWIESFTSFLAFLQILFWCLQSSYCHSMGFLCVALIKYQSMVIVCSSLLYWKIMYSNICLSSNKQKKRHSELFGFSFKKSKMKEQWAIWKSENKYIPHMFLQNKPTLWSKCLQSKKKKFLEIWVSCHVWHSDSYKRTLNTLWELIQVNWDVITNITVWHNV